MAAGNSLVGAADLFSFAESLLSDMPGLGVEVMDAFGPIPLAQADPALPANLGGPAAAAITGPRQTGRGRKKASRENDELPAPPTGAASMVVPCEISAAALATLSARDDVVVWPNTQMTLLASPSSTVGDGQAYDRTTGKDGDDGPLFRLLDLATSAGGTDCRPFREGVTMNVIRNLLGVDRRRSVHQRGLSQFEHLPVLTVEIVVQRNGSVSS